MTVAASLDVQATHAVMPKLASSRTMPSAMTAMKAAATTASLPPTGPFVALRQALVIPQKLVPVHQVPVLKMPVHLTVKVAAIAFNVPAVNAQVVISSAEALWVVIKVLETILRLATAQPARSNVRVVDLLCLEITSVLRCNRISWTAHLVVEEVDVTT